MQNLFCFLEEITSGNTHYILDFLSVTSVIFGMLVLVSKNPVISVLYLIGLFSTIALYLLTLGLSFIGLSYLLVYVGAVTILFLFVLMLINVRVSELLTNTSISIPLALIIGILFNITLYKLLPTNLLEKNNTFPNNLKDIFSKNITFKFNINYSYSNIDNKLHFVSSQLWDGALAEYPHITMIGNVFYTVFPMWLILTSIILLLSMVGAIVITQARSYTPVEKKDLNPGYPVVENISFLKSIPRYILYLTCLYLVYSCFFSIIMYIY